MWPISSFDSGYGWPDGESTTCVGQQHCQVPGSHSGAGGGRVADIGEVLDVSSHARRLYTLERRCVFGPGGFSSASIGKFGKIIRIQTDFYLVILSLTSEGDD